MIRKILDLSTAHLTFATCQSLWDGEGYATLAIEVSTDDPAFVLLNVPPADGMDDAISDWPDDLLAVATLARSLDCDFIKFDVDGDILDDLPTYDQDAEPNGLPLGSTIDLAPSEAILEDETE